MASLPTSFSMSRVASIKTTGLSLQPPYRLLDFITAHSNEICIEIHTAKASLVLCRKSGAMSK